jgi:RNA 3'-terminal phosphate cyclase (ATP)
MIAEREWETLMKELDWTPQQRVDRDVSTSAGPGNFLAVHLEFEHVTEVLTAFGERGLSAEHLARNLVRETRRYQDVDAPVGEHLADQLMVPLVCLAGGRYRTMQPGLHARTNADVVNLFLPGAIRLEPCGEQDWLVTVLGRT